MTLPRGLAVIALMLGAVPSVVFTIAALAVAALAVIFALNLHRRVLRLEQAVNAKPLK
jgi:membrane protein implicated in regulation of membrane protease activity